MNSVVTIPHVSAAEQPFSRSVDCSTIKGAGIARKASRVAPRLGPRWAMLATLALGSIVASSAALAGNESKPCGIFLDKYQEFGKLAEFKIALRCGSENKKEAFPINEPLLIGLTATTSDKRESDEVEIEYDFALQNIVVAPETNTLTFTFHAQLSDIPGKTYVFAKVWPRTFLQDCADGRPGCMKYGYALGMPNSLLEVCFKKDQDGDKEFIDSFACRGSDNYRFKFR